MLYENVFIISGIVFSLTAIIAIYYSNLDLIRNQKTDFCISKNKVFVLGPIGINLKRYPYNELVLSKEFTFLFIDTKVP